MMLAVLGLRLQARLAPTDIPTNKINCHPVELAALSPPREKSFVAEAPGIAGKNEINNIKYASPDGLTGILARL